MRRLPSPTTKRPDFRPASLVRVFLNSADERAYWSWRLMRSEDEIRIAVAQVGNTRTALGRHFTAQARAVGEEASNRQAVSSDPSPDAPTVVEEKKLR